MAEAQGQWVPVLDGSGWERYAIEDGVMHREFKGVHDDILAEQCKELRKDISLGKNPEGGNVAFMLPPWILSKIEQENDLAELDMNQKKRFWKGFESTRVGQIYKVRGV